jgi:hypothetical protein
MGPFRGRQPFIIPSPTRAIAAIPRRGVIGVSLTSAPIAKRKALSLAAARKMVAAAEAEAERNHWPGVVAVVDNGGWVILLERMDNPAMTASVELAAGKARSAALFKKPTQALEDDQPRSLRGDNRSRLHRDARWASGRRRRRALAASAPASRPQRKTNRSPSRTCRARTIVLPACWSATSRLARTCRLD